MRRVALSLSPSASSTPASANLPLALVGPSLLSKRTSWDDHVSAGPVGGAAKPPLQRHTRASVGTGSFRGPPAKPVQTKVRDDMRLENQNAIKNGDTASFRISHALATMRQNTDGRRELVQRRIE